MMTSHPLVAAWLQRVEGLANHLPPADREELLAEPRAHLDRSLPDDLTDAQAHAALQRMDDPADIVGVALDDGASGPPRVTSPPGPDHLTTMERLAVGCLVAAGLLLFVWPVSVAAWVGGVYLLLRRTRWTGAERLVALFVPVGLAAPWIGALSAMLADLRCQISQVQDVTPTCPEGGDTVVGLVGMLGLGVMFVTAIAAVFWLRGRVRRRL